MKKCLPLLLAVVLLCGCGREEAGVGLSLRETLLAAQGCSFDAVVTADYGDKTYEFSMACIGDAQGNIHFTVTAPETIAGIAGSISTAGGRLTFDDQMLAFPLLADGEVSPVSAPWLFLHTLRGGYIRSGCRVDGGSRLTVDDSYEADALQLEVWLNGQELPVAAEIQWQGRRILSMRVENFTYL